MSVGEGVKEEEQKGNGVLLPREQPALGLCLVAFKSSLAGWNPREGLWRVSAEYSSVLQVRPFRVVVCTDWTVTGQGVLSHRNWS